MPLYKAEAVVLKSQKSGETSKIIFLYTNRFGKMKIIAKGARGFKSHFYGTLEPINYISIVFYFKETREIQFLSQADIIEPFKNIKNDLYRLSLALIACEIIARSQYAEESNPYLFKILVEFLNRLENTDSRPENYLFWFMLKFLAISGFKPQLNRCIVCGLQSHNNGKFYFSIIRGGYVCNQCKIAEKAGLLISQNTLQYLSRLENSKIDRIIEIDNSEPVIKESGQILTKFMEYHVDGLVHLNSMEFLKQLKYQL